MRGRGRGRKKSGCRSVIKVEASLLDFEARDWKTMRKRFIVFHSRPSNPSNEARTTTVVDAKICETVGGGWRM